MCTAFSTIMSLNYSRMSKEEKEAILQQARVHLDFTMRLITIQHNRGGYFVFEHPAGATSWQERSVQKVLRETGATVTTFDQCQIGLKTRVEGVEGPARKRTTLMSTTRSQDPAHSDGPRRSIGGASQARRRRHGWQSLQLETRRD